MAARINKITHDEKTKRLIQASQLLNRLTAHGNGTVEMTTSQVQAAKIVIAKSIPDLKQMELVGDPDRPVAIQEIKRIVVGG
jgi:hypothetical protein